jgi:hypothetical protein
LVFLGIIGGYYLVKTTNIFSYFKGMDRKSNLKNLHGNGITKVKNTISPRKTLEIIEKISNPFVNHASSNYKGKDRTVKFKEMEIEKFKDLQEEKDKNLLSRKSFTRRSINIQNPIPDQYIIVGKPFNLTIDGNTVFNSSSALSFLNTVNIPSWLTSYCNPKLIGSCDIPGGSIVLSGDYAYVSAGRAGLQIIDISDPINPTFKSSYNTSGSASRVAISGNYAYMVDYNLQIIDISDPSSPTFKGFYGIPGNAGGIKISGNYAYIAAWRTGLHIVDISDPLNPIFKGSYITPKGVRGGIAVSGDYAYMIDSHPNSFHVVDISDPSNPMFKSSYRGINDASMVVLSGNYVYINDNYPQRLKIMDVSDPSNPQPIGGEYSIQGFSDMAISENYAYVTGGYHHSYQGNSGMQIIDIRDLSNLRFKGSYDTVSRAVGVAFSGNYVYVTDGGLQIINPSLDELILSGVSNSIGTYNVDIEACNKVGECINDSFNVVVENNAPIVLNPIQDQTATINVLFNYIFPINTFVDSDGHPLTYTAKLSNNESLPSWLNFNSPQRIFFGMPNIVTSYSIKVTANDAYGGSISDIFNLIVKDFTDTVIDMESDTVRDTGVDTDRDIVINNNDLIISSMTVTASIACIASFCIPLTIGMVIAILKRYRNRANGNNKDIKEL